MTPRRTSQRRCLQVCSLLLIGLVFLAKGGPLSAGVTFTPLGLLGGTRTQAYDVSGNGLAVVGFVEGFSNDTRTFSAFHWTNGTSMFHPASESAAPAVSGDGSIVVGTYLTPVVGFQAFRWTAGGDFEGLGDFLGGRLHSGALDTSADGSVVVGYGESDRGTEAFRWTRETGMVSLGYITPDSHQSVAAGVSNDGAFVVGGNEGANSNVQAFRWSAQSGMVGLGFLPGAIESVGHRISGDGTTVVGYDSFPGPQPNSLPIHRAYRWTERDGMVGLGTLPGGDFNEAYDVSADGSVIVGAAITRRQDGEQVTRPFYWTAQSGMVNLQDFLISAGVANLDGWTLFEARGVSFDGLTVAGNGFHNGTIEAWVATIPEPSTFVLAALAALVPFGLYLRKTLASAAK